MRFVLEIECDNAAFTQYPEGEVARILRETAEMVEGGAAGLKLRDINGNLIGKAEFMFGGEGT